MRVSEWLETVQATHTVLLMSLALLSNLVGQVVSPGAESALQSVQE